VYVFFATPWSLSARNAIEGVAMYRKILVPLDGSPVAEEILTHVVELAKLTGAEICLLRVVLAHTFPGADPTERQVQALRKRG
jgi:nucleotide-binding universal stress UspA family protein